jgi:hypothetical protein
VTTNQDRVTAVIEEAKVHWTTRWATVRQLAHLFGITQSDIANALGMSRQSLSGRITGSAMFQPWELAGIAVMMDVPRDVLDLNPKEAILWAFDNHPERLRNF